MGLPQCSRPASLAREMNRRALGMAVAMGALSCFRGEATLGGACDRDEDCGADQLCTNEVCGYCGDGIPQAGELCSVEAQALTTAPRATPGSLARVELERDGTVDLIARGEDGAVELWDGDGTNAWTVRTRLDVGGRSGVVRVAGLDDDQAQDLVIVDAEALTLHLGYGDGSGAWSFDGVVMLAEAPIDLEVAGANGEGPAWVAWVDGRGLWQAALDPQTRTLGEGVALAGARAQWLGAPVALDADDALDLVVADVDGMRLEPWWGDGAGGLSRGEPIVLEGRATEVFTLDVDGDGDADVVVPDEDGGVTVLVSDGEGGLVAATRPVVPGPARIVAVADLDRDGDRDLVVVADHDPPLWLLQLRAGRYPDALALPVSGAVGSLLALDTDRDGLTELLLGPPAEVSLLRMVEVEP